MTIDSAEDVIHLQKIGSIVANTMQYMAKMLEPGMTTKELDDLGRKYLESFGARSAPEITYNYPGATCISVNNCVAHGVPDNTIMKSGDMVNIDVSAELNGYFGDTGSTFLIPPNKHVQVEVCRAAKKARNQAISKLKAGVPLNIIGKNVEKVARKFNMQIIKNLGSHGVGSALHEDPEHKPSYYDRNDKRKLINGQVITVEPFLSVSADMVEEGKDGWSLFVPPKAYTAQFEHTVIITNQGPIITTIPGE